MKIDRLISIIMILLDKKRVCAEELAETFEVSLRTIYRDMENINMAGIPVRSVPGVGGGFEIMQQYKVDHEVFSASDLTAILTGLSGLSGMIRGDELASALSKVKRFIPAERAKDIAFKSNQIRIDLSPWIGNGSLQPHLETVKAALQENKLLTFDYIAHHGNQSVRTVEPYQLVLKSGHWYLQAYCRIRDGFRLFRLSRMSRLKMEKETFVVRDDPKPEINFSESLESIQTRIKLRIHQSIMDRVLDFCAYEDFSPEGEEFYIVRFPFIENEYHYDILLSFGERCVCLEPPHIRAGLKRRIHAIAALYEDETGDFCP